MHNNRVIPCRTASILSKLLQHESVSDCVHERKGESGTDKSEEVAVVLLADTVVDPSAVVVEFIYASVALAAVFGRSEHVGVAHLTQVLILCPIESQSLCLSHPL
jgi:hypothetical protein